MNATLVSSPASQSAGNNRAKRWQAWSSQPGAILELCEALVNGTSLEAWAKENNFSCLSVADWIEEDPTRSARYERVWKIFSARLAREILTLADDRSNDLVADGKGKLQVNRAHFARTRLQIETRKSLIRLFQPSSPAGRRQPDTKHQPSAVKEVLNQLLEDRWDPDTELDEETTTVYPIPPRPEVAEGKSHHVAPVALHQMLKRPVSHSKPLQSQPGNANCSPTAAATGTPPANDDSGTQVPQNENASPTGQPPAKPIVCGVPGRNEPCVCGSGRKFKKCCG